MSLKYAGMYSGLYKTELYEIQNYQEYYGASLGVHPPLWLAVRRGYEDGELTLSMLEGDAAQKNSGSLHVQWECTYGPY